MEKIILSGQLTTSQVNTPISARARINTLAEVGAIENPAIGEIFYCVKNKTLYVITGLKSKQIGEAVVPNALVDTYTELCKVDQLDEAISKKQDVLVSGVNIKTVNGVSLVGSGAVIIPTEDTIIDQLVELDGVVEQGNFKAVTSDGIYTGIHAQIDKRFKVLPKEEFDNIAKDENIIYFVYENQTAS